jgi:anti-sigma B factor antagonist
MPDGTLTMGVRTVSDQASVVDIEGDITSGSESALMDAYSEASHERTRAIVLNFTDLDYMNSGGIGLLVTLLVRANRQHQRLLAYGLTEHYREIFGLTRLDEAIGVYDNEEDALAAASTS